MVSWEHVPLRRPGNAEPEFSMDGELIDDSLREWLALEPWQRLARSQAMRKHLKDPAAIHDAKLFPRP